MMAIPYPQRIYCGLSTDLFRIEIATHFLFLLPISHYLIIATYFSLLLPIFVTDFLVPLYSFKGTLSLTVIVYHFILWYKIVTLNCMISVNDG